MISLFLFTEAASKDDETHKAKLVKENFIFVQVARRLPVFSLKPMTTTTKDKKRKLFKGIK